MRRLSYLGALLTVAATAVLFAAPAYAAAPATTTTAAPVTVTTLLDRLFDGSMNVFISAFNAMVASWAVVAPILVALAVGLYLWRRFTNRMGA